MEKCSIYMLVYSSGIGSPSYFGLSLKRVMHDKGINCKGVMLFELLFRAVTEVAGNPHCIYIQ